MDERDAFLLFSLFSGARNRRHRTGEGAVYISDCSPPPRCLVFWSVLVVFLASRSVPFNPILQLSIALSRAARRVIGPRPLWWRTCRCPEFAILVGVFVCFSSSCEKSTHLVMPRLTIRQTTSILIGSPVVFGYGGRKQQCVVDDDGEARGYAKE